MASQGDFMKITADRGGSSNAGYSKLCNNITNINTKNYSLANHVDGIIEIANIKGAKQDSMVLRVDPKTLNLFITIQQMTSGMNESKYISNKGDRSAVNECIKNFIEKVTNHKEGEKTGFEHKASVLSSYFEYIDEVSPYVKDNYQCELANWALELTMSKGVDFYNDLAKHIKKRPSNRGNRNEDAFNI